MLSFRDMMDRWDAVLLQEQDNLDAILAGNNFVFYFMRDKEIYGAPEESRITFARMKFPTDDVPAGWAREATFKGFSINDALEGRKTETVIGFDDLKDIKVIDEEVVRKKLAKKDDSEAKVDISQNDDPNVPPNMSNVDEK